jgi:hypothetical protein
MNKSGNTTNPYIAGRQACEILPERLSRAGVIQTLYDFEKAHGGELKAESIHSEGLPAEASAQTGMAFILKILIS